MGTRKTEDGVYKVYDAAKEWVNRALRTDDSLFTPGTPIWSSQWLGELHQRFLNNPDESDASFSDKLQIQLKDSRPEVYQLMGEALYVYFLIVATKNSKNEQQRIDTVLGWSESPVAIPPELVVGLTPGILNPGIAFHTFRPYQVGLIIEFVEQWKQQNPDKRKQLLDDPWAFKEFLMGIRLSSLLLRNKPNIPSIQRQALLHLVYPDTFEAIVSLVDKYKIAKTFEDLVTEATDDVDRQLAQIRQCLEPRYDSGDRFDFYMPEVQAQWEGKCPPPPPPSPPPEGSWSPANIAGLAEELLWEPAQLQEIIDDLQEKRQVIFYGPPGTGKTYVAREIARQCELNGGDFEIVQFHPSYSYEDFVQGFRPRLHNGQPGFDLVDGPLRRIAEQAKDNPDATFILVIDELNRGNVAKVFGELYFLLEYRDEAVRLQYGGDDKGFSLPPNLWFICTMNTADRSIALMDAALRRRFYFAPFFPNEPPIEGLLRRWLSKHGQDTWVAGLVDAANGKLDRDTGIGPSYFMGDMPLDETRVRRIWKRAVLPYVEEQCFGDDAKLRGFDFDRLKGQLDGVAQTGDGPTEGVTEHQVGDADSDAA